MNGSERRASSSSNRGSDVQQFPDFDPSPRRGSYTIYEEEGEGQNANKWNHANGSGPHNERWQPRQGYANWANASATGGKRHGRQKSLSDAIKTIRTRKGSVTANAQELADALKAPVSYRLIALCLTWYLSSALTNTSSKAILNAFPKPITLTVVQFMFVFVFCLFFAWLAKAIPALGNAIPVLKIGIRSPSREVVRTTLPLALFQLFGHLLSAAATAQIPVSLVHTIKGLSPLFTVLAYRCIFNVPHSTGTYFSLVPLTLGVVLACSVEFSGNLFGIMCAFVAALIFVTQNIYSKTLFNEAARAEADAQATHSVPKKLDKLNLLCYCSGMAFLLNFPIWFMSEGVVMLRDFYSSGAVELSNKHGTFDHGRLALEFIFNGAFHFGQNIMAFVLLSAISPVTYSVASLIKRVFVIVAAIIWFGNKTTNVQAVGIGLTFLGLYLYDRTSDADKADRKARLAELGRSAPLLPTTSQPPLPISSPIRGPAYAESPMSMFAPQPLPPHMNGGNIGDSKKEDGPGRPGSGSNGPAWLPPGTKQEETWQPGDSRIKV